jgi:hypothetical protein
MTEEPVIEDVAPVVLDEPVIEDVAPAMMDEPEIEEIPASMMADGIADGLLMTEAEEEAAHHSRVRAFAGDEEAVAEGSMLSFDEPAEVEPTPEPEAAFVEDEAFVADALPEPFVLSPEDEAVEEPVAFAEPVTAFAYEGTAVLEAGVADPVVTIPGDDEVETEPPAPEPEIRAQAIDPADPASGMPQTSKVDDFDIAFEVERLLRRRKWDKRESPFTGFESPPGRF